MSYRENQNAKSLFDVLDSKELQNQSDIHASNIKLQARSFISDTAANKPGKIKQALEEMKTSLTRTKSAYIRPLEIMGYNRKDYLTEEQKIVDAEIIQWFIQNLTEKGFEVKRNGSDLVVEFKKQEK